ncbi:gag-pol polyprotein, partial [Trifolium medium]|nr:gag-pol polyprotein [Trifolium medium]
DDKLVIVSGEDDTLVSHLGSFRYVETGTDVLETAFQALEIANAVTISPQSVTPTPRASITSWRNLKTALDEGYLEGWGRVLTLPEKKDRLGLGYQPCSGSLMERQGRFPSIQETFHGAGFRSENQINMMEHVEISIDSLEASFQTLKITNVEKKGSPSGNQASKASITSWKSLKMAIDNKLLEGWGQV